MSGDYHHNPATGKGSSDYEKLPSTSNGIEADEYYGHAASADQVNSYVYSPRWAFNLDRKRKPGQS